MVDLEDALELVEEREGYVSYKVLDPVKLQDLLSQYHWIDIRTLLVKTEACSSVNQAKKLVKQGAVEIDGVRMDDPSAEVLIKDGSILHIGKRFWRRIRL